MGDARSEQHHAANVQQRGAAALQLYQRHENEQEGDMLGEVAEAPHGDGKLRVVAVKHGDAGLRAQPAQGDLHGHHQNSEQDGVERGDPNADICLGHFALLSRPPPVCRCVDSPAGRGAWLGAGISAQPAPPRPPKFRAARPLGEQKKAGPGAAL